jgi:membrane fusion protein, heavy metal efflux system
MAATLTSMSQRTWSLGKPPLLLGAFLLGVLTTFAIVWATGWSMRHASTPALPIAAHTPKETEDAGLVKLPLSKWKAAGLKIEPVVQAPLTESVWRTGKVALDEQRVAHLSPLVEGIVRAVHTRIGQDVKAGDLLVVLDSKELGQAKLELAKARLANASAKAQYEWTLTVNKNTAELLRDMAGSPSVAAIEARFRGRPIGDWREKLITAYSRRLQKKGHLDAQLRIQGEGAASPATVRLATADLEAAEASYQGLREEIFFQNQQQLRAADQKLREAQTQVSVSATQLLMMGYRRDEVEAMDPVAEGAQISHYPIRAPFSGTILALQATLAERVSPLNPVLQLGDLSQVWVQADIPEADLPIVRGLKGKKVAFKGLGLPGVLSAQVFHVGDQVDKATRTVPLLGIAGNRERLLRAGMFVDVQIEYGPSAAVVQVPATALQRYGGETFVFVPLERDEFRKVQVKLGRSNSHAVEIVEGLRAGEPVVAEGGFALKFEMLRGQLSGE